MNTGLLVYTIIGFLFIALVNGFRHGTIKESEKDKKDLSFLNRVWGYVKLVLVNAVLILFWPVVIAYVLGLVIAEWAKE